MSASVESVSLPHILARIVDNPEMQRRWKQHYITRKTDNPGSKAAWELLGLGKDSEVWADKFCQHPQLLRFTREVIEIERGAARSRLRNPLAQQDSELIQKRAGLDQLAGYLSSILPEEEVPPVKYLSEDQQRYLKMLERETAQPMAQPIRRSAQSTARFSAHMWEEIKDHKMALTLSAPVAAYMTWLTFNGKLNVGATKLSVEEAAATGMDATMFLPGGGQPKEIKKDYSLVDPNYTGGCHPHNLVKMIAPDFVADAALSVGLDKVLSQESCMTINKAALATHGVLNDYREYAVNKGYVNMGKGVDVSMIIKPGTPAADTFVKAIETSQDQVAAVAIGENFALHAAIPSVTYGEGLTAVLAMFAASAVYKKSKIRKAWGRATRPVKELFRQETELMSFGMRQAVKPVTQRISYGAQSIKEFMAETAVCYAPGLTVNFCRFAEKRSIKKARIAAFKSYAEHKDDQKSFWKSVGDFAVRSSRKNFLGWAGFIAGAAHVAQESDYIFTLAKGLNAEAAWMGIGGMVGGNTVHKLHKYFTRKAHFERATEGVGEELKAFAFPENTMLDQAGYNIPKLQRKKTDIPLTLVGSGVVTAVSAVDFYCTGGHNFATVAGHAVTWGPWLAINPIEDTTVHGFLGASGYALGAGTGATVALSFGTAEGVYRVGEVFYKAGTGVINQKIQIEPKGNVVLLQDRPRKVETPLPVVDAKNQTGLHL